MPWEVLSPSQGWEPRGPVHSVPLHVLSALGATHGAHPPAPCPPSGRAPSPAPRFLCSTTTLGVTMALTWHQLGLVHGGEVPWVWGMWGWGFWIRHPGQGDWRCPLGGGNEGPAPVSLLPPCAGLSQPWGSAGPWCPQGFAPAESEVWAPRHGCSRGVWCWARLHPPCPITAPLPSSPKLSQAWHFGGGHLCHAEGSSL